MKLFDTVSSPFVRKGNMVIHWHGLESRIERLSQAAHPVQRDVRLVWHNPLGQVPALVLDDGLVLSGSRVICEYLDRLAGGGLFPAAADARWIALRWQSLADGLLDAAILMRYECNARPVPLRWQGWVDGQWAKIESVLQAIDAVASTLGTQVDIGTLSIACALGYLDFRFAERRWRDHHRAAAAWYANIAGHPALQATLPRPRERLSTCAAGQDGACAGRG